MMESMPMSDQEQRALLTICLMAAFADGAKDEREREQIRRIAESISSDGTTDLPGLYRDVLLNRRRVEDVATELSGRESRQFAYEMAVCVCDADGAQSDAESAFLERLRAALGLASGPAQAFAKQADDIAEAPLKADAITDAPNPPELEKMVLNYAMLNGALELLPQSLASMAILPLQTKMVYRIGKAYGYELDRGHIKDFAATLGIGFTGQYLEQIGRRLMGGLLGRIGGGLAGGLGSAATGSAFSFATTYALGQVATKYYSGGRTLSVDQLKQVFDSMLEQGRDLQARHSGEIQQKARTLDLNQISALVRQS